MAANRARDAAVRVQFVGGSELPGVLRQWAGPGRCELDVAGWRLAYTAGDGLSPAELCRIDAGPWRSQGEGRDGGAACPFRQAGDTGQLWARLCYLEESRVRGGVVWAGTAGGRRPVATVGPYVVESAGAAEPCDPSVCF
jgi:hypothetical protein